ncbi:MAG: DUF1461 domain-containing protein [Firmicutes bacterium]|nr:DUF1461 domain-containing protein [Bacillota bacterium]
MGRIVKIILSWCLVIAVPVVSLGLACNALVRLPDLYQYTMNDTQLLRSFNAQGQEEAVAHSISKYMQHRADELQYQYDEEDEMSLLFSRDEQNLMAHLRFKADIWAGIFFLLLVLAASAIIVLYRGEHYEIIRIRIKIAIGVYIAFALAIVAMLLMPGVWEGIVAKFAAAIDEEHLLYSIFSPQFIRLYSIASGIMGAVIMGIASYLVLKYIKPKSIFW